MSLDSLKTEFKETGEICVDSLSLAQIMEIMENLVVDHRKIVFWAGYGESTYMSITKDNP